MLNVLNARSLAGRYIKGESVDFLAKSQVAADETKIDLTETLIANSVFSCNFLAFNFNVFNLINCLPIIIIR